MLIRIASTNKYIRPPELLHQKQTALKNGLRIQPNGVHQTASSFSICPAFQATILSGKKCNLPCWAHSSNDTRIWVIVFARKAIMLKCTSADKHSNQIHSVSTSGDARRQWCVDNIIFSHRYRKNRMLVPMDRSCADHTCTFASLGTCSCNVPTQPDQLTDHCSLQAAAQLALY